MKSARGLSRSAELATTLGFPNYAAYVTGDKDVRLAEAVARSSGTVGRRQPGRRVVRTPARQKRKPILQRHPSATGAATISPNRFISRTTELAGSAQILRLTMSAAAFSSWSRLFGVEIGGRPSGRKTSPRTRYQDGVLMDASSSTASATESSSMLRPSPSALVRRTVCHRVLSVISSRSRFRSDGVSRLKPSCTSSATSST